MQRTIAALLAAGLTAATSSAQVQLTGPHWVVNGSDQISWNSSRMFFTSQTPVAGGFQVAGYFEWISSGVYRGSELFNGSLSSSLHLTVEGYQLVNPISIQLGHYEANVRPDGLALIEGTWIGLSQPVAGTWSAQRCYPNCDGSTAGPLLNPNDFQCFLTKFAAGDSYANCDGSTVAPILNANDFQCFINKYAAGCS